MTIGRLWEENQNAAATLDGFQLRPLLKQWPVCVVVIVPMFPLCYHQSGAFINVLGFIGSWDMQFRINEMKIVVLKYCLQRGILTYPPAVSSLWPGRVDIEQRSTEILAWVPAELSPAHNIWEKFGLALLRWGGIMPAPELFVPIKLSGRALYDDGQMINSNVIKHVTNTRVEFVIQQTWLPLESWNV